MNALAMNAPTLPRVAACRRTSIHPGVLERAFAVVVLFLSTGGLLPLLRLEGGIAVDELEGDPVMQIIWLAVYGVTLLLLATRAKETLQLLGRERWLLLLCGLAAVSVIWSVAPGVTFRRTVALFGTTAFGVYLASRFTVHELLRLLYWVLSAAVVLSATFVVIAPTYGIGDDGAWRGIFVHKNILGRTVALAVLALLFRLREHGVVRRLATIAIFTLSCAMLLGSRSVTGLLTAAAVGISMPLWVIFRVRSALAIAFALFGLVTITGAATWVASTPDLPELAVAALGRDVTLTGRTGLWPLAVDAIAERWWFGHGYGAFWLGWDGESASIWRGLSWRPAHAHNGILDLGLELGVAGIGLFAVGLAVSAWRAAAVIRRTATAYGLWPIAYLMFTVTLNLAETTIIARNSLFWVLYVATCMWLIRPRIAERTVKL